MSMKSKLESAYAKALTGTFKVINPIKKTIKKTECEVHLYIQENALEILNCNGYSDEYKLFKEYKSKIDEGLVWADQDFKCYHHFYNPKEEKGMYGYDDNGNLITYSNIMSCDYTLPDVTGLKVSAVDRTGTTISWNKLDVAAGIVVTPEAVLRP